MGGRRYVKLVAGAAAVVLGALGAALLVGCGGPPEQRAPATIRATPAAGSATTIVAKVGDTVIVSLEANPTTGYAWTFAGGDTFAIEESEYVPDPNPGQLVGAGGTQVVTLTVTASGDSDLTGTYARSWETPSPAGSPDVTVTIRSEP